MLASKRSWERESAGSVALGRQGALMSPPLLGVPAFPEDNHAVAVAVTQRKRSLPLESCNPEHSLKLLKFAIVLTSEISSAIWLPSAAELSFTVAGELWARRA